MARGWWYTKLALYRVLAALLLSFFLYVICLIIPFFLFLFVSMLSLEHGRCSPDILLLSSKPRILLGSVEARLVNVKNTHARTHTRV